MRKRLNLARTFHKLPKGIIKADAEGNLTAAEASDFPIEVSGIPEGGATGQVLSKQSEEDRDTGWADPPSGIPEGGDEGQVLGKTSDEDGEIAWITPESGVPSGGDTHETLVKQSDEDNDAIWKLLEVVANQNAGGLKFWTGSAEAYDAIEKKRQHNPLLCAGGYRKLSKRR